MSEKPAYLNMLPLAEPPIDAIGGFVRIGSEEFYKIENYDKIRPFFISLVSHSDHWLFISTTGGLSAGRKSAEYTLFPYYTDDRIRDNAEFTGSKTILSVRKTDRNLLWEPFSTRNDYAYRRQRNLYKNRTGSKLIFEEINEDLGLSFQYTWSFSEEYGFVRESQLSNNTQEQVVVELLDGIQNILPFGVSSGLQSSASNLVNAYKKSELDEGSQLAMFMLSAIIVDKAEPSEALKTTTVWSSGLEESKVLLSSLQLDQFRSGRGVVQEVDVRAERGAYFLNSTLQLDGGHKQVWNIVADVNQDHADVVTLIHQKGQGDSLSEQLAESVKRGSEKLLELVGRADGLQLTNDKLSVGRHYSNVLFNIMRGGIFDEGYEVEKADFVAYTEIINKELASTEGSFFKELADRFSYKSLLEKVNASHNVDLIRICYEYLPLTFSRRHGDPSRPWNKFTIATKDEDGKKLRWYEGNWRDIFQNWEALALSFPDFTLSMITKFVNATTIDGYNPYRITREGIDWEIIEPDDPWSYIGYWGDHQIIYLQKFLEIAMSHQADDLTSMLTATQFVYANVPYRIKGYNQIAKNPQDTIDYDHQVEEEIEKRVEELGSDGKLVQTNGQILKANLTEKLLVTFLAKMSNYIPEGGIWLNTQRPEWNDANNALVGNGVSMVTLNYMRRFAASMIQLFDRAASEITINHSVATLFEGILDVLESNMKLLDRPISNGDRKIIIDQLGRLGENYRAVAYKGFISTTTQVSSSRIQQFFEITLAHIDHTIRASKRSDGLYHAYNLISFNEEEAVVDHLYEMLEGQVAVLSSGLLQPEESLQVLDALKESKIYRPDQYSYMLYPNRILPKFLEKNLIPMEFIQRSKLAQELLATNDRSLLYVDVKGDYHFNGSFNNAGSLRDALDKLEGSELKPLVQEEYEQYLNVFEQMFNHKSFTGRSGTFYGYEGLGSIYWHMVSKLLVAIQENIHKGWKQYQGTALMGRMIDHYYQTRAGIGINKSPELYGSFPTDPYSHTPGGRGVQQPGMTGQVKEDVLNRWAELGVYVANSSIHFEPKFLSDEEYLTSPAQFHYYTHNGTKATFSVGKSELAYTYCQVPIVYRRGQELKIEVCGANGQIDEFNGTVLPANFSKEVFLRSGRVERIIVTQIAN